MRALFLLLLCGLATPGLAAPPRAAAEARHAEPAYESVVTGSRTERRLAEAATATEVIRREDIEASGAQSVADLLEERPGVEIVREPFGAGVRLMGLDPQYTLILVDGERLNGRIGGTIDLSRLPVQDIERIEIVKGAGAALYGSDAIAGVVHIITRRARRKVEADALAQYGSFDATHVTARTGLRKGDWSGTFSAGYHHRGAYRLDPTSEQTHGSAFHDVTVAHRSQVAVSRRLKLRLSGDFLRRELRGVDAGATGAVFDRVNLVYTASAVVAAEIDFSAPQKLRVSASYTLYDDQYVADQRNSAALDQKQHTRDQLVQINLQYDRVVASRLVLTGLGEAIVELLASERLEGGTGLRGRGALVAQADWTVTRSPFLVMQAALRWDIDSQFGHRASPQLTLRCDPTRYLTVRFHYGWGYRAPNFRELLLRFENAAAGYVVQGNPALGPESSQTLSLAAELKPSDAVALRTTLFRTRIDGLIIPRLVADEIGMQRFQYVNVDAATTQGVELQLSLRSPIGLQIEVGYAFNHVIDEARGRPLEGRPAHRGTASLTYRHRRWGLEGNLRVALSGPRPFYLAAPEGGDSTVELPAFAQLDARLAKSLWRERIGVFLGADNLLGAGDPRFLTVPPRTFYGGVQGRY